MKAKRKEALKELKLLLRLDAKTPIYPRLLQDYGDDPLSQSLMAGNRSGDAQMGDSEDGLTATIIKCLKKPTAKQRKANQLRRPNLQRKESPMQLADYQV